MNYFIKLFLLLIVTSGFCAGLFATFRWGLVVGSVWVMGAILWSGFVVFLVKFVHARQVQLIVTKQFKPNIKFAQSAILLIALLVLIAVPLLFIYTPLHYKVAPGDLLLVIIVFEVVVLYNFFRAFINIKRNTSSGYLSKALEEPIQLPSFAFFMVFFFTCVVGVFVSRYNKEVALIIVIGCLLGHWIYRDFSLKKDE